ncbi:DUF4167 domain-containing protein [Thalassospira sp. MIT1370]|uniref:DUF4167 domain-containing protein n=1 Tax=unclassified Thalassospira TaxID=2648997 RepID=UPI00399A6E48
MRNNNKRPRGRQQSNKRPVNPKFQNFDSNGPDGRVRGNAQQVYEKYVSLAKDCTDDPVLAENFYQHAEHYHRILQAAQEWENQRREERGENNRQRNNRGNRDDRNDAQSNQGDDQQGDNTENAENASNDSVATPADADGSAGENTETAASDDGDDKPKRATRTRRTDGRATGRGRPRKTDDADASDKPAATDAASDDTPADAETAEQGDETEKKPRRAASGTARTRGRHPTARRGRSRAAGRDDEEAVSSDEGTEPVSA